MEKLLAIGETLETQQAPRTRRGIGQILGLALSILAPTVVVPATASGFGVPVVYPVPVSDTWADVAAIGDFNGDGLSDVVLATTMSEYSEDTSADWQLFVFLQQTSGALGTPFRIVYSTIEEEGNVNIGYRRDTGIHAADLNNDGADDIIVGRRRGLSIVYGDSRLSAGSAVVRIDNTTGAPDGDVIVTLDVDGDGLLDIATHNETAGLKFGITVYYGAGDFTDHRFVVTRSEGGNELKVGDLNGDGFPDLALTWVQGLANGAEIFHNDGRGGFSSGIYIPRPPILVHTDALAVGDFSGDGLDDLVLGGMDLDFDARKMFIYYQRPQGDLAEPAQLPSAMPNDSSNIPDTAIAHDMDGDGRDDLLLLRSGGLLGYFEQRRLRLSPERLFEGPYLTWSSNQALAAGDLNSDGCADVAAANYNYGLVVWHGHKCSIAVNGGAPRVPPVPQFIADSSSSAPSPSLLASAEMEDTEHALHNERLVRLASSIESPNSERRWLQSISLFQLIMILLGGGWWAIPVPILWMGIAS